jgi:hypothetical protein
VVAVYLSWPLSGSMHAPIRPSTQRLVRICMISLDVQKPYELNAIRSRANGLQDFTAPGKAPAPESSQPVVDLPLSLW